MLLANAMSRKGAAGTRYTKAVFRFFGLPCILCLAFLSTQAQTSKPSDIVLITLGGLGADRLQPMPPHLAALAAQATVFDHAYAQAPGTVVSHAGLLTGTYPQTNGATEFGAAMVPGAPFLPLLLQSAGYHTAAFLGTSLLDAHDGLAPGFDHGFIHYDAPSAAAQAGGFAWRERPPGEVIAQVMRWLSQTPGPHFVWIHLAAPAGERGVAQLDQAIGDWMTAYTGRPGSSQALVLVTADHGDSSGSHGESDHGIFLYDATLHVPLIMKLPAGARAGTHVTARVRLVDVAPSILEAARIPIPPEMQGESLLRAARSAPGGDQPAYARGDLSAQAFGWSALESFRVSRYLYIRAPQPELYDLTVDPTASKNLAVSAPAKLQALSFQLQSFDDRLARKAGPVAANSLGQADIQKLASLGYVGLQPGSAAVQKGVTGIDPKTTISTANAVLSAWRNVHRVVGGDTAIQSALSRLPAADQKGFLAEWTRGTSLAREHKYAAAVTHLRAAIQLQPDVAWLHIEMADALQAVGDHKTAIVHLEIAGHLLPESTVIQGRLATARR